eukprot:411763_1
MPALNGTIDDHSVHTINESRKVLYDPNHTGKDYVETYEQYWAKSYNQDAQQLGFKSWSYALERIQKYMPNKESMILDFNGGTGQVGKRLSAAGYSNLHISDGSSNMIKQA